MHLLKAGSDKGGLSLPLPTPQVHAHAGHTRRHDADALRALLMPRLGVKKTCVIIEDRNMNPKKFYDRQTAGGTLGLDIAFPVEL